MNLIKKLQIESEVKDQWSNGVMVMQHKFIIFFLKVNFLNLPII